MEQSTVITENSVELSEVITNTVEEVAPIAEAVAAPAEAVAAPAEAVAAPVEAVAAPVEAVAAPVEAVAAAVEAVTETVEAVVETVEEATSIVEAVAAQVEEAATVTEVIAATVEEAKSLSVVITDTVEDAITVTEVITNIVEEANSLTATQKEALDTVFNDVKDTVEHILLNADISIQIKLMQMISPIIKTVQDVSAMKLALTGADKKAVVLECGRKCIKMMLKDHLDMLALYDTIAEQALETMLDLSRNLKSVHDKLKELEKKEPSQECCLEVFMACMAIKNK
jgi:type I site-specific restriction endonuclease